MEIDGINFEIENFTFFSGVHNMDVAKFLKMKYGNVERCKGRFLDHVKTFCEMSDKAYMVYQVDQMAEMVDQATPFSYQEAFKIENSTFRATVFGSINVGEMIQELGHERVKVEGKEVTHRKYKEDGSYEMVTYAVVYELHKVFGEKMSTEDSYAIKCWCTSTNKEHWLWVEDEYAEKGPLEAIASTFRVYEEMIPFIECIKRQGDVVLYEMKDSWDGRVPSGKIVPLTAEQYFGLLVSQS